MLATVSRRFPKMTSIPHDTTPEAAAVQLAVWRGMSCEQRSQLAAEMSENVRQVAAEGVRRRHPEYDENQVRLGMIRLLLGDSLFLEAYPGCEVVP